MPKRQTWKEERETEGGKRDRPCGKSTVREHPREAGMGMLGGDPGTPSRAGPTPPWKHALKGESPGERSWVNRGCLGGQAWTVDPHWK